MLPTSGVSGPKYSARRFDGQADSHDARTGIPDAQCLAVARGVVAFTDAAAGALLLDLGAGTGLPGASFPRAGLRYLGIDASRPMLAHFAARGAAPEAGLVRADIDRPWPLSDATADLVFSARAAHLFAPDHLVAEVARVMRSGGALVLGRVRREPSSPRRRLRDEMRARLVLRGHAPADAGAGHARILAALREQGGTPLPTREVASWEARHSVSGVLAAWRETSGLGGCELAAEEKEEILGSLESWARRELGPVDAQVGSEERFVLEGVRWMTS